MSGHIVVAINLSDTMPDATIFAGYSIDERARCIKEAIINTALAVKSKHSGFQSILIVVREKSLNHAKEFASSDSINFLLDVNLTPLAKEIQKKLPYNTTVLWSIPTVEYLEADDAQYDEKISAIKADLLFDEKVNTVTHGDRLPTYQAWANQVCSLQSGTKLNYAFVSDVCLVMTRTRMNRIYKSTPVISIPPPLRQKKAIPIHDAKVDVLPGYKVVYRTGGKRSHDGRVQYIDTKKGEQLTVLVETCGEHRMRVGLQHVVDADKSIPFMQVVLSASVSIDDAAMATDKLIHADTSYNQFHCIESSEVTFYDVNPVAMRGMTRGTMGAPLLIPKPLIIKDPSALEGYQALVKGEGEKLLDAMRMKPLQLEQLGIRPQLPDKGEEAARAGAGAGYKRHRQLPPVPTAPVEQAVPAEITTAYIKKFEAKITAFEGVLKSFAARAMLDAAWMDDFSTKLSPEHFRLLTLLLGSDHIEGGLSVYHDLLKANLPKLFDVFYQRACAVLGYIKQQGTTPPLLHVMTFIGVTELLSQSLSRIAALFEKQTAKIQFVAMVRQEKERETAAAIKGLFTSHSSKLAQAKKLAQDLAQILTCRKTTLQMDSLLEKCHQTTSALTVYSIHTFNAAVSAMSRAVGFCEKSSFVNKLTKLDYLLRVTNAYNVLVTRCRDCHYDKIALAGPADEVGAFYRALSLCLRLAERLLDLFAKTDTASREYKTYIAVLDCMNHRAALKSRLSYHGEYIKHYAHVVEKNKAHKASPRSVVAELELGDTLLDAVLHFDNYFEDIYAESPQAALKLLFNYTVLIQSFVKSAQNVCEKKPAHLLRMKEFHARLFTCYFAHLRIWDKTGMHRKWAVSSIKKASITSLVESVNESLVALPGMVALRENVHLPSGLSFERSGLKMPEGEAVLSAHQIVMSLAFSPSATSLPASMAAVPALLPAPESEEDIPVLGTH